MELKKAYSGDFGLKRDFERREFTLKTWYWLIKGANTLSHQEALEIQRARRASNTDCAPRRCQVERDGRFKW